MAALFRTLLVREKDSPITDETSVGTSSMESKKPKLPVPEQSPVAQKVSERDGYFVANPTDSSAKAGGLSDKSKEDFKSSNEEAKTGDDSLEWMVRSCAFYNAEYSDCRGFRSLFNDYFVYGEAQDCGAHKENYNNCKLWREKGDKEALEKLIQSERTKVRTRIRNHLRNDIWENRSEPPADWNKPLPKEIEEEYEKSYLKYKTQFFEEDTKKYHGNDDVTLFSDGDWCVVM